MNCQKGDLAIIVRSKCGNEGRIVRCLEYVGKGVHVDATDGTQMYFDRDLWRIDQVINSINNHTGIVRQTYHCHDDVLRPLHGDVTDDDVATTFSINTKQPA